MANTFDKIAGWVSDGTTNGTYFRNIPQDYKHLALFYSVRSKGVASYIDQLQVTPNVDESTTKYDILGMDTHSSSGSSVRAQGTAFMVGSGWYQFATSADSYPSGTFGHGQLHLPNYSVNGQHKVGYYHTGVLSNNASQNYAMVLQWGGVGVQMLEPITSMRVILLSSSIMATGSALTLYGIKV